MSTDFKQFNEWWLNLPLREAFNGTLSDVPENTDVCACGISRDQHGAGTNKGCDNPREFRVLYSVAWEEEPAMNEDGTLSTFVIEEDGTRTELGDIMAQCPPDAPKPPAQNSADDGQVI